MNGQLKVKKIPEAQLKNPKELHPTKDGLLRVTSENAAVAAVMILNQIRDTLIRIEKKLNG